LLDVIAVLIKKKLATMVSYKLAMVLELAGLAVTILQYTLMGHYLDQGFTPKLLYNHADSLLSFLLSGIIYMNFCTLTVQSIQQGLANEIGCGTLEAIAASQTPLLLVTTVGALYDVGSFLVISVVSAGTVLAILHVGLSVEPISLVLVVVSSAAGFIGLGLMAAGILLYTKRGDIVSWGFAVTSALLGGVFFPVEALPAGLGGIARHLPVTIGLQALREALFRGRGPQAMAGELIYLGIFALTVIPLGFATFLIGCRWSRAHGNLGHY
jgi:ABC-2 type transport system permease protein